MHGNQEAVTTGAFRSDATMSFNVKSGPFVRSLAPAGEPHLRSVSEFRSCVADQGAVEASSEAKTTRSGQLSFAIRRHLPSGRPGNIGQGCLHRMAL
jgi:hypothetical protein